MNSQSDVLNGVNRYKRARYEQRFVDIAESEQLLLELASVEPTIQQCFKIMESTCLSQGIFCKIDNKVAGNKFLDHIDEFYTPFCRAAIRAMCVYGFVPWRLRKISSGDMVPEVLPAGTFSWHTELNSKTNKGKRPRMQDDDSMMVIYRLKPTGGEFKEEEIDIYVHTAPVLDVVNNSNLYATVVSPLSHLLSDYKALRQGLIRRSHADAWNTTAKIITQFDPKLRVEDNPTQYLMDFVHEDYYMPPGGAQSMYPPFEAHNVWQREQIIRRQFQANPSVHHPEVFALPRDHSVASQIRLDPCEDIQFLNDKFKRDVCSLLGIPYEMIQGKDASGMRSDSVKKTMASGRLFSTNMQDYCKHIQRLLRRVYRKIYGDDSQVVFTLVPMPRLEIETISDLKILSEIGALTPDMSLNVSKTLLGENNMAKKQLTKNSGHDIEHIDKADKKLDEDSDATDNAFGNKNKNGKTHFSIKDD